MSGLPQTNMFAGLDPASLLQLFQLVQGMPLMPPMLLAPTAAPAVQAPAAEPATAKRRGRPRKVADPAEAARLAEEQAAQQAAQQAKKVAAAQARADKKAAAAQAKADKQAAAAATAAAEPVTPVKGKRSLPDDDDDDDDDEDEAPAAPAKKKRTGPTPAEQRAKQVVAQSGFVGLEHVDEMSPNESVSWTEMCGLGSIKPAQHNLPHDQRTLGRLDTLKHFSQKAWFTLLPREMILNEWYKRPDIEGLPKGKCCACQKALGKRNMVGSLMGVTMTHVPTILKLQHGLAQTHWTTIKYKCGNCAVAHLDSDDGDDLL